MRRSSSRVSLKKALIARVFIFFNMSLATGFIGNNFQGECLLLKRHRSPTQLRRHLSHNNDICPPGGQNASQSKLKLSRWFRPNFFTAIL